VRAGGKGADELGHLVDVLVKVPTAVRSSAVSRFGDAVLGSEHSTLAPKVPTNSLKPASDSSTGGIDIPNRVSGHFLM
jgi:hypothetical protein